MPAIKSFSAISIVICTWLCLHASPIQVFADDKAKDGKGRVFSAYEEVKGTTAEVILAGRDGKKRLLEESDLLLSIPAEIQARITTIAGGSQTLSRVLKAIRINLLGFDASGTKPRLSGVTGFEWKLIGLKGGAKIELKEVANKSLDNASYVSVLFRVTTIADGNVIEVKCDAVVVKVGETKDEDGTKHDKRRAFVTWYGPVMAGAQDAGTGKEMETLKKATK
jgi:hypothetical protein